MEPPPPPDPLVDDSAEWRTTRLRLRWSAGALIVIVVMMLVGESVARAHPVLLVGNAVMLAAAVATVIAVGRRRWSLTAMHAMGAGLTAMFAALPLLAMAIQPDLRFAVMLIAQMIAASLLFVSTTWLSAYLVVVVGASIIVELLLDRVQEGTLIAACAVLAMTLHLALGDRHRRNARVHARELATALALARRQLEDKEQAEREREQAERDRESMQAQLLQAQKMEAIGTLAGGVAHDMNNALSAIIGFAECIAMDTDNEGTRDDAEQITLAARRAAELTRNLLGFSRRGQFQRTATRPESLITGVATLLARTLPKGIKVETTFADQLAGFEIDSTALTHALVNLCINASDAMGGHGVLNLGIQLEDVDVGLGRTLELEAGRYVVLSVRDTGHGMDAATQARIFEPFFTTKAQGHGTGLGLAMVYGTVKRHDGAIAVDSAPGRGTTFKLYLRAAVADVELASAAAPSSSTAIPVHRGGHVLVIDDEDMVRTVIVRALERAGYAVSIAVNGQAGLEVLAEHGDGIDLVILDMAMPVMAGPETFRRARGHRPALPVLLTSGFTSAEDARALLEEGALGLIEKPFPPSRLLSAVERAISGRGFRTELEAS